jgi:hypothetical protein
MVMDNHKPQTDDRLQAKRSAALVAALRAALASPSEQRLFRSGKLDGLFSARTGPAGDAAVQAMRQGLLEVSRTEVKGKVVIEWVRLTPKGLEFLYQYDSPRSVLSELHELLRGARAGVPIWMDEVLAELQTIATRCSEEMQGYLQRLDALTQRVEEAIRRAEAGGPALPHPIQQIVPWGLDALEHLDHRKAEGADDCTLPELFETLREKHPTLSITDFHDGLRRLADNRALRLVPFGKSASKLPQPEYALLDGSRVLYHVVR